MPLQQRKQDATIASHRRGPPPPPPSAYPAYATALSPALCTRAPLWYHIPTPNTLPPPGLAPSHPRLHISPTYHHPSPLHFCQLQSFDIPRLIPSVIRKQFFLGLFIITCNSDNLLHHTYLGKLRTSRNRARRRRRKYTRRHISDPISASDTDALSHNPQLSQAVTALPTLPGWSKTPKLDG